MPNWAIIRRSLMTDLSKKTPGKSCGEIRNCRPEVPVHQVHQGSVSECPDHPRTLPHRTAGRKSAGQCKDKPNEEDERLPLQGI